jgi:gas vesicle protein
MHEFQLTEKGQVQAIPCRRNNALCRDYSKNFRATSKPGARVVVRDDYFQKERFMNNAERTTLAFLTGLGIGVVFAALITPRSGEEMREWVADTAERKLRVLRRKGGRSIKQLQIALSKGEERVAEVLRNGKDALESVAAKLD